MLNRANRRVTIFYKEADLEAFERRIAEALERVQLKLVAYCVLSSHWHFVFSPEVDVEMSRFGQRLGLAHTATALITVQLEKGTFIKIASSRFLC